MKREDISRVLLIQTAYIGDVILMTPLIENLRKIVPTTQIDVLINHDTASVLAGHPHINELLLWNKRERKKRNLLRLLQKIRENNYDAVLNCHRYFSTRLLTALSGAKCKVGFNHGSLARWLDIQVSHQIPGDQHEVDRNLGLLSALLPDTEKSQLERQPKLYLSIGDQEQVLPYQAEAYLCIAPTSVWFTKQFPAEKWIELIDNLPFEGKIYLLGAPTDYESCEIIRQKSKRDTVENLAGKLSLLQSAALMAKAVLNYVNDSAPLHLASAMNAPVCAIFCSTVPEFGFTPLSDFSEVVDVSSSLSCRPCGIHGHGACPQKHFRCAYDIRVHRLVEVFQKAQISH
ncbi:glycosyltransferase family 9 protein [Tunicatimonas pelagia]|uniref:glycosyltransferase family 9 protein n=1 Tax=Tunicatimonas pelagia TaxID=931531 RepID=UPI0026665EAD|nr:glycosyltransferase family 9 protein [Tunicatimonas pelagia]WKN41950.1 glycosyltransferase family 9 protein [Tunicatimonas pelagia]